MLDFILEHLSIVYYSKLTRSFIKGFLITLFIIGYTCGVITIIDFLNLNTDDAILLRIMFLIVAPAISIIIYIVSDIL